MVDTERLLTDIEMCLTCSSRLNTELVGYTEKRSRFAANCIADSNISVQVASNLFAPSRCTAGHQSARSDTERAFAAADACNTVDHFVGEPSSSLLPIAVAKLDN